MTTTMKAVVIREFGKPLDICEVAKPEVSAGVTVYKGLKMLDYKPGWLTGAWSWNIEATLIPVSIPRVNPEHEHPY